jgi:hypothetical protein
MAHTPPTLDDFRTRFAEFEDEEDEIIELAIADATRMVGTNWLEADYPVGILFLAAHFVQTGAGGYDSGGLRSVSIGSISVTYADPKAVTELSKSSYGTRFVQLRRMNVGGPIVV